MKRKKTKKRVSFMLSTDEVIEYYFGGNVADLNDIREWAFNLYIDLLMMDRKVGDPIVFIPIEQAARRRKAAKRGKQRKPNISNEDLCKMFECLYCGYTDARHAPDCMAPKTLGEQSTKERSQAKKYE